MLCNVKENDILGVFQLYGEKLSDVSINSVHATGFFKKFCRFSSHFQYVNKNEIKKNKSPPNDSTETTHFLQ